MPALPLPFDLGDGPVTALLLRIGMTWMHTFLLVAIRLTGLFLIGPILGQSVVPPSLRVLLVLSLSFLITPTLAHQTAIGFAEWDADSSGTLNEREISPDIAEAFGIEPNAAGEFVLDRSRYTAPIPLPSSLAGLGWEILREFTLGLTLGLGVMIFLTGIQMAGELIDQQTGIALGGVFNPGLDIMAGATGQFLMMLTVVVMLLMEPFGGHLLMIDAFVESCRMIPVGTAPLTLTTSELLTALLQQAFSLGVQVFAPFLAAMSMVALTLGFLGYTVPQINVMMLGFPVRAMVNLFILAITLSGTANLIVDSLPDVIGSLAPRSLLERPDG